MENLIIKASEGTSDLFPGEKLECYEINGKDLVSREGLDKIVERLPKSSIEEIVLALLLASERTYFTIEDLVEDLSAENSYYYEPEYLSIEDCIADFYKDQADSMQEKKEAIEELFIDTFYGCWGAEGLGDDDLGDGNPNPWGCPWYWDGDFKLDFKNPQKQAKEFFEKHLSEIRRLVEETRSLAEEED